MKVTYSPEETIKRIKKSLKRKTRLNWSVLYHDKSIGQYMTITSLPKRRVNLDYYDKEIPLKKGEKGNHISLSDQKILSKAMCGKVARKGILFPIYQRGYWTAQAEHEKELTRINVVTGWGFDEVTWEWDDPRFDVEFDEEPFTEIIDATGIEIEEITMVNPLVTLANSFMKKYENDLGKVFETLKNVLGSAEAMNVMNQI